MEPGDVVIDCPPTFGMYGFDAGLARGTHPAAAAATDFSLDVPAIEAVLPAPAPRPSFAVEAGAPGGAGAGEAGERSSMHAILAHARGDVRPHASPLLLFVTSPNNPDGSLLDPARPGAAAASCR